MRSTLTVALLFLASGCALTRKTYNDLTNTGRGLNQLRMDGAARDMALQFTKNLPCAAPPQDARSRPGVMGAVEPTRVPAGKVWYGPIVTRAPCSTRCSACSISWPSVRQDHAAWLGAASTSAGPHV